MATKAVLIRERIGTMNGRMAGCLRENAVFLCEYRKFD